MRLALIRFYIRAFSQKRLLGRILPAAVSRRCWSPLTDWIQMSFN